MMRKLGFGSCWIEGCMLAAGFLVGCGNGSGGPAPGNQEPVDAATPADATGSGNGGPLALIGDPFGFATQILRYDVNVYACAGTGSCSRYC